MFSLLSSGIDGQLTKGAPANQFSRHGHRDMPHGVASHAPGDSNQDRRSENHGVITATAVGLGWLAWGLLNQVGSASVSASKQ
ncbi:hypothetical protein [Polaromonas sp. AER18D-145]|uniref:hypothetical protein n=1 Tax=Polaromonas sp. AER18D-145 TaxID=1977060 RepID=UPI001141B1F5|nr:hypothetical protein [Polaromonas sp. AER18D-145]